jgi:acyl-CoA thioester hydrolase
MSEKINIVSTETFKLFKHKYKSTVKFHEVDSFGVVHNIQYFYWLENARLEYFRYIDNSGIFKNFGKEYIHIIVNANIDYMKSARMFDDYEILTRISWIKDSSFGFENLVLNSEGVLLAKATAVIVYFDLDTNSSIRIPDNIREMILKFEGTDLILKNN